MAQFLKLFLTSAVVFLIFDLFWLLVASKKMYQQFIGDLMGDVKLAPAVIFTLFMPLVLPSSFYFLGQKKEV